MSEKYSRIEELAYDCYARVCTGFINDKEFMESLEENKDFMENFQEKYRFEPEFKKLIVSRIAPELKKALSKEKIPFDEAALGYVLTEFCDINNKNYFTAIEKEAEAKNTLFRVLNENKELKDLIFKGYTGTSQFFSNKFGKSGYKISEEKLSALYKKDETFRSTYIQKVIGLIKEDKSIIIEEDLLKLFVEALCDDEMYNKQNP